MNSKKTGHNSVIALLVFLIPPILLTVILVAISPGTPEAFRNERNKPDTHSFSGKVRITINGVEQGMFIQSSDIHNPVLLFVHGGPGMPEFWLTQRYPTDLED
ncbi:MAG: hypothetical protein ACPLYX_11740 [Rectinema subterraneum]|uniref:hypothetical protein n=1 Tax=Rectinema subterraneum TaxID=2653714 RepID=UPI003C7E2499